MYVQLYVICVMFHLERLFIFQKEEDENASANVVVTHRKNDAVAIVQQHIHRIHPHRTHDGRNDAKSI